MMNMAVPKKLGFQKKPQISIIMAAYNAEKTIAEAIDSVLVQTYPKVLVSKIPICSR